MGKPLVSVVIPVYNVENYLAECVDSIICQTETDLEIILVDDGSTDKSSKLCDEYAQRDARVRVIHRENGGLSAARNTGLDAASGEFVYFLDSDDYILENTIEKLMLIAEKEGADVVFFDAWVFFTDCDPDPNVYSYHRSCDYGAGKGQDMLLKLLDTNEYRTAVPLMLFKRSFLLENSLRFKEGIIHEDELFTFYVYYFSGVVAHLHEELYARRVRQASIMTGASVRKKYESIYEIYMELSDLYRKKQIHGEVARRYLARMCRSVIGKYKLLSAEDQSAFKDKHDRFKKNVLKNKGYGDIKLKIKCSSGLSGLIYRAEKKICSIFVKSAQLL